MAWQLLAVDMPGVKVGITSKSAVALRNALAAEVQREECDCHKHVALDPGSTAAEPDEQLACLLLNSETGPGCQPPFHAGVRLSLGQCDLRDDCCPDPLVDRSFSFQSSRTVRCRRALAMFGAASSLTFPSGHEQSLCILCVSWA